MDRFIVGTGRCGSTLLSRMLGEHPRALSVFEFFNGLDAIRRFAPEPLSGDGFAELIAAEQPFVTAVLRRGYPVAEITYPFDSGRYAVGEPLPWILVSMLPRLSGDPDALFDEVMGFARALPDQPFVAHARQLFDWLTNHLDRDFWIERSGSSIDYLGALREQFPDARFLHIHRDGREAALSMREHHAYRLPISLMYGAPTDAGTAIADLGPLDLHAPPTGDDPISQVLSSRPPARYFGQYWTDQVLRGEAAWKAMDDRQFGDVGFEQLVAQPVATLTRIAEFFDLDPAEDGWVERGAALVRGVPTLRYPALPDDERAELDEATRPGMAALGREPA